MMPKRAILASKWKTPTIYGIKMMPQERYALKGKAAIPSVQKRELEVAPKGASYGIASRDNVLHIVPLGAAERFSL